MDPLQDRAGHGVDELIQRQGELEQRHAQEGPDQSFGISRAEVGPRQGHRPDGEAQKLTHRVGPYRQAVAARHGGGQGERDEPRERPEDPAHA